MIDKDRIDALVDLALPLPEASRVTLLDGLTRLKLTPEAWRRATPLADTLRLTRQAEAYDVLARVPLLTVRSVLRSRARRPADALGRRIALALARQHDPAGVERLMAEFRQRPDAEVACALASVLQPGHGVVAEDLEPGLESPDEEVRLWAAIAIARVLRRGSSHPDFEPLELLWDAFVRPGGGAFRNPLFDGPPAFFKGDPAWAAGQIAVVRPLPPAALDFVLGLKENDFDGWEPRRPESVADSGALRALVAGLTGRYHADGTPISDVAPEEVLAVPEGVAFETELEALLAGARQRPDMPGWAIGNEVLDLARSVSPATPLEIGPLLAKVEVIGTVPREQLAWAVARIGEVRVVDGFSSLLQSQSPRQRIESIEWLRDVAAELDAPAPYLGAGGETRLPDSPSELIDDRSAGAEVPGAGPPGGPGAMRPPEAPRTVRELPQGGSDPRSELDRAPPRPQGAPRTRDEPGEVPEGAALHFVLTGENAHGDAVLAGRLADLEFRFDRAPADVLATVESDALDQARQADRAVLLEATAYGSLSLPGARQGVARFSHGALLAPVVFTLAAGAVDERDSGVHVEFIVRGETVHQVDLSVAVLADAEALRRRAEERRAGPRVVPGLLDDAAGAAPPPPQRVRLALALDAQGFRIDLTHWTGDDSKTLGPFLAPDADRARFENLVGSMRKDLEGCYRHPMWMRFTGAVGDGEAANQARAELPRACSTVAAVGARLNSALREAAPAIAQALDYIETELPAGSTLTIATDAVYLPWEILYPRPWLADFTDSQRARYPLDAGLFWGARFAIETVQLRNSGSLVEQRRKHLAAGPKISVNLHPKIVVDGLPDAEQPADVQRTWATRRLGANLLEAVQDDCKAMRSVLQDAKTRASLLYIYCHGSAGRPFGGGDELLELAKGCTITPAHLAGDAPFDGAPIVFLNSCESAAHSPLAFSSFLKEFRRRGALGMIAASFAVPIVFGAHFGAELAQCVLERRGSLAVALLQLRRRHLLDGGPAQCNPIPLFYALQCQITYPQGGSP